MAGVELATAYVALTVETKGIREDVERGLRPTEAQAKRAGDKAGKKFAGGMKTHFGTLAGMFGGVMAGLAIKDFVGDSLAAAKESNRVGHLTEAVIKATGGAAKVTAEQVKEYAAALAAKTGIDRKEIQAGANMLLTFKNIHNEAGKGNDIFNQATQAALDLSKAGFGSVGSASKALGKALNDPLKGITALGRVGIQFTEDQKKQIKTLVKHGDLLGAQKIIMDQVEGKVGGVAEAVATTGGKATVAMDELKELLGNKLLPIGKQVSLMFLDLVDGFKKGEGAGGQLKTAWEAIQPTLMWIGDHLPILGKGIFLVITAMTAWKIVTMVVSGVTKIHSAVLAIHTAVIKAQNSTIYTWLGVKALEIGAWVRGAASTVAATAAAVANKVVYGVGYLMTWLGVKGLELAAWARGAALTAASTVAAVAHRGVMIAAAVASGLWTAAQWALNVALNANPISLIIIAIAALIGIVVLAYKKNETFRKIVDAVWAGIKRAVLAVVDWFKNTAWPWIKDFFAKNVAAYELLRDKAAAVWKSIKDAGKAAWEWIKRWVFDPIKTAIAGVGTAFGKTATAIRDAWDKIKGYAKAPIKFVIETVLNNGLIAGFNWLSGKIGGPHIDKIKMPAGFKSGGVLPGYSPGRDIHQFYSPTGGFLGLSGGEAIMRPEWTKAVGGAPAVARMNDAARNGQAFAGGGIWDNIKGAVGKAAGWVSDKASDVWKAVTNPIAFLKSKLPKIPGAATMVDYGRAAVNKGVGLAADKITGVWGSFKKLFDSQGSNARTSQELTAAVKRILPDTTVSSGYRPGAITALGNVSQHSKNLAIDIVPHSVHRFDKIKALFPHAYQLFYSPRDGQTLLRGKPWRMDSVTKRDHWDHIHLSNKQFAKGGIVPSFDSGGVLSPGYNLVHNGTGAPETLRRDMGDVTVVIPLEDLAQLKTLEDFFDRISNSRNVTRKTARSGRVTA